MTMAEKNNFVEVRTLQWPHLLLYEFVNWKEVGWSRVSMPTREKRSTAEQKPSTAIITRSINFI